MKFKKLAAIAIGSVMAVGMCAGVTACKKEKDPNTIYIWAGGQWTGSDGENLKKFCKWYEDNNTLGLKIDVKIKADFEQVFAASTISSDSPDVMIWDRFNTPTYAADYVLEPIDDLIERDGIDASKFNATAYNELSYAGVQYGLPLDLDLWGICINMDIVDAYNTANPSTKITCLWEEDGTTPRYDWNWDDVLEVAGKLKGFQYKKGSRDVTVYNGYDGVNVKEFFIHNYFSTGEDYLIDGKPVCNNDAGVATLEYLHKLRRTGDNDCYKDQKSFVQGNLAMFMRPTYFVNYLNTYAKSMNVRFMPQPAATIEGGDNRGVMGGFGMAIPRPIKDKFRTQAWEDKKAKCWEFMKDWLYNDATMREWAEVTMTIPALISAQSSPEVQANTVLKDVIPFADKYTTRPGVPGWTSVQVEVFNNYVDTFCKGGSTGAEEIKKTLSTIERESKFYLDSYGSQKN